MPVKIRLSADSVWSWIAANPQAVRAERVRACIRKAQKQAIQEWTQLRGGDVGLALRFEPEAFGVLGLTARAKAYQTRQIKTLGNIYPYIAPIYPKGSGTAFPSGEMKRDILGGGFSITNKNNGSDTVVTQLSITKARALNLNTSPNAAVYRHEFLGLDRGGRRDAEWMQRRANMIAQNLLLKEMTNARRQFLRVPGDVPTQGAA